jgi:cell wall-associated NlpC family hydrolase
MVEPGLIVEAARRYEGTPYRYGGESVAGMDCSGLVFRVFTDHDIVVPRTTEEQFRFGRSVMPDRLRPGDLVFFDDGRGRVQHVGLVVGGDRFLHASTSRRRVVEDSLRQSYFRDRFVGARRILGH